MRQDPTRIGARPLLSTLALLGHYLFVSEASYHLGFSTNL